MQAFKNIWGLFFAFLLLAAGPGLQPATAQSASDPVLQQILARFSDYTRDRGQEKIFLQTDKPFYLSGDTIWFQAYLRRAETLAPSDISQYLNVALLSADNQVVLRQKLLVGAQSGSTQGHVRLPADLPAGAYTLLAYTQWMLNFSPEAAFARPLAILHFGPGQAAAPVPAPASGPSLRFFPEGGRLVYGLESRVALQATDSLGFGRQVSGTVLDQHGSAVASFSSSARGLASFVFRPEAGGSYQARVVTSDGKSQVYDLPRPASSGLVLQVSPQGPGWQVQVQGQEMDPAENKVYLVLQAAHKIWYAQQAVFAEGSRQVRFQVPRQGLPEGVAQLMLFDAAGKPAGERLVYVHHNNLAQVSVRPERQQYGPNQQVTVALTVRDGQGQGLPARLAGAVTDAAALPAPAEHLLSYLYLSSWISGKVEQPADYLQQLLSGNSAGLDELLLTRSWRPFTWQQVLAGEPAPNPFQPEKELVFRAQARDAQGQGLPAVMAQVLMIASGRTYAAFTDEHGYFRMAMAADEPSGKMLFRFYRQQEEVANVSVVALSALPDAWRPAAPAAGKPGANPYYQKMKQWAAIRQAYGGVQARTEPVDTRVAMPVKSQPTTTYVLKRFASFPSVAEMFHEIIEPATIKKTSRGPEIRLADRKRRRLFAHSPLFLINGQPTLDNRTVLNLAPGQIEQIDLYNAAEDLQAFGHFGRDGVIALTTKPGYADQIPFGDKLLDFEGLAPATQPAPQQPGQGSTPAAGPRFRPMLFWQADLVTDDQGKARLTFYSADDLSHYRILVQGFTTSGQPVLGEGSFQVVLPK